MNHCTPLCRGIMLCTTTVTVSLRHYFLYIQGHYICGGRSGSKMGDSGQSWSVPAPTPAPDQHLDCDSDSDSSCQKIDDSDSSSDSSCQKINDSDSGSDSSYFDSDSSTDSSWIHFNRYPLVTNSLWKHSLTQWLTQEETGKLTIWTIETSPGMYNWHLICNWVVFSACEPEPCQSVSELQSVIATRSWKTKFMFSWLTSQSPWWACSWKHHIAKSWQFIWAKYQHLSCQHRRYWTEDDGPPINPDYHNTTPSVDESSLGPDLADISISEPELQEESVLLDRPPVNAQPAKDEPVTYTLVLHLYFWDGVFCPRRWDVLSMEIGCFGGQNTPTFFSWCVNVPQNTPS